MVVEQRVPAYPLPRAVLVTLAAAVPGLITLLAEFPSFASSLGSIAWKIAMLAVLVAAIRIFERRRPVRADVGLVVDAGDGDKSRAPVALIGSIAMLGIAMFWSEIPGLRELAPAGEGESYDAQALTTAVLVFELAVRYPIGVLSEEMFFRGFLQPRIAVAAPVVTGVLFAIYHLQQFETIPSLVPFGIGLGLLRWWTGSIWAGVAVHYLGNAMFILSLR
jgi:membrane protease YdiL (CAAX protease family)